MNCGSLCVLSVALVLGLVVCGLADEFNNFNNFNNFDDNNGFSGFGGGVSSFGSIGGGLGHGIGGYGSGYGSYGGFGKKSYGYSSFSPVFGVPAATGGSGLGVGNGLILALFGFFFLFFILLNNNNNAITSVNVTTG